MHCFQRMAVQSTRLIHSSPQASASSSICVFCQHLPRRFFVSTTSPTNRSEGKVSQKLDDVEYDVVETPDLEFEVERSMTPEEARFEIEQKARRRANTRKQAERRKLRKIQETIESTQTEIQSATSGYEPAKTWDGLRRMGGKEKRDKAPDFEGFLPAAVVKGEANLTAAMYRAVVETLAAMSANQDPHITLEYKPTPLLNATRHATISIPKPKEDGSEGTVTLSYPNEDVEQAVLNAGLSTGESAKDETVDVWVKRWGRHWLHLSLQDPVFKLAVVKRLIRITGRPISDHKIHSSSTVFALLSSIVQPDPPKSVFESLQEKYRPSRNLREKKPVQDPTRRLLDLPNVKVSSRRQTYVDEEMNLGRWKVIEQELKRRGLPVLGGKGLKGDGRRSVIKTS